MITIIIKLVLINDESCNYSVLGMLSIFHRKPIRQTLSSFHIEEN